MGGIGSGMVCLSANGSLEHVSWRHHIEMHQEPWLFASLHSRSDGWTRTCQGPVPDHRIMCARPGSQWDGGGSGRGNHYGLPSFAEYTMRAAFPIAEVALRDEHIPVACSVTGWSPFIPGDDQSASLPVAMLEYEFSNHADHSQELVFAFHADNFLIPAKRGLRRRVEVIPGGFALECEPVPAPVEKPCGCNGATSTGDCPPKPASPEILPAAMAVTLDGAEALVDAGWFRSGWFDTRVALYEDIRQGTIHQRPSHADGNDVGASVSTLFTLQPGERRRLTITLSWYQAQFRHGGVLNTTWYATRFPSVAAVAEHARSRREELRRRTLAFATALHNSDLPDELVEAVARPLAILKSPSLLRLANGRLWGWEGCHEQEGCCPGSCTHVYNYAQALAFLFPQLERSLREVEFECAQNEDGHQIFRAPLPFEASCGHGSHAAADGQLGGLIQMYREWRLCGDDAWLRRYWPAMRAGLEYCIRTWDPDRAGRLAEPHHNTYDIEFWGEDGLCSLFYLGALEAMVAMARHLGEEIADWAGLAGKVRQVIREELDEGWLRQRVHWKDLHAKDPTAMAWDDQRVDSPEAGAVIEREGPRYQYGRGVLSDAGLAAINARIAGLGAIIDEDIERRQIDAVLRYNFKPSLREHACAQRPSYAVGDEGGVLMCSWPDGSRPAMPFPYSDEVWTGTEHQVAAHCCAQGRIADAVAIERAVQGRYDGKRRNPFNEYECGYFYVRALASYGILFGCSGARYDAVENTLYLAPTIAGDFRCFFAVGSAWGQVGVREGEPFLDLVEGELTIERVAYTPCPQTLAT
jgi:uncharacterized protein (DUF608 family)